MGHAHEEKEVKDQPLFGVGPAFMAPASPLRAGLRPDGAQSVPAPVGKSVLTQSR